MKMKSPAISVLILLGLAAVVCSHGLDLSDVWDNFKKTYNKQYHLKEERFRQSIWEKNVYRVQQHNLEYDMGLHTYSLGINEYSDLTEEEYTKYLLGARPPPPGTTHKSLYQPRTYGDAPDTVDWTTKGYVTPIKNQGQCGSCWAFSSTGALEGQHYRKYKKLPSLSEQNLVDCTEGFGNAGCNGGWMNNAFNYVQYKHALDTEEAYPYEGRNDDCRFEKSESGTDCEGFMDVERGHEEKLKMTVAEVGPVAVAIDASHSSFQQYKSGVYVEPKCKNDTSDHAVLVVGYGTYQGQDYWLVKNSWGTTWGLQGYIMMARNKNNMCAIATYASFPVV